MEFLLFILGGIIGLYLFLDPEFGSIEEDGVKTYYLIINNIDGTDRILIKLWSKQL
jgi:hypothetical protein